ncbi:OmpA family protein [Arcobacter sp. FWKO B]|uniref:OmpA family protein n=1 Tax=Arcobacter sp. FWKO B TaxID=2593672 RepID=UPI0018A66D3F|nr:OmpA family protein [Arcobacter sp. FWKO B]QOG11941.1 OmpA family protein [Arcobacter sp. FWKO B]
MNKTTISLAVCTALFLGGCAPSATSLNQNAGKIGGTAIGAGIGAAIGKQFGGRNGALLGAAVGGLLGYMVGDGIDKRRAELAKIAQEEKIEIYSYDIVATDMIIDDNVSDSALSNNDKKGQNSNVVGDVFTIISDENQFDIGSSKLNANAAVAYNKFAQQYAASNRKILIIGHTDDSGDSSFNQKLSEDRAKYVSEIFAGSGIKQENIYYLGAGETQPIADNNTNDGASKNRRVEIIELNDEAEIIKYASSRVANPKFFREVAPTYVVKAPKKEKIVAEVQKDSSQTIDNTFTQTKQPIPTKTKVVFDKNTKNYIDFKGEPIINNEFTLVSKFGEPVHNNSSKGLFTTKAVASSDFSNAYVSCVYDKPRFGGETKSLATGEKVSYSTKDFKKGLNETSWTSNIDDHLIGFTPVGVLKDGAKVTQNPDVYVYKNYDPINPKNADVKLKTHVNTYQGTQGMIYRVFVDDDSSQIKCVDIVFDEKNTNQQSVGKLYYANNNDMYQREFQIKQLQKN